MPDTASLTVRTFSAALQTIPVTWTERQRASRKLLKNDPLEQLVPVKLLLEGLSQLLDTLSQPENPLVLFMDRTGGGDGARAAAELIPLLGKRWPHTSLIHISFATPSQGMGTLVRSILTQKGAEHGVSVHVLAHNRPAEGLMLSKDTANEITKHCNLVITFTPGGAAGLHSKKCESALDLLLSRSHLAVLSYPDPESVIAELLTFEQLLGKEPTIEAIRFRVQIEIDGVFEDLGTTELSQDGDAKDRLWVLLDNAKRHRYQILIEPIRGELPSGDSLCCPCRSVIETTLHSSSMVDRIVPAGSSLVVKTRGKDTLI